MSLFCIGTKIFFLFNFDTCSNVVGPRHPLKKDPDLDYDIDSDEEWEEVSCLPLKILLIFSVSTSLS